MHSTRTRSVHSERIDTLLNLAPPARCRRRFRSGTWSARTWIASTYCRSTLSILTWQELTPLEWREASERAITELKATGRTTPCEKEYLRKDGSRWWALFAAKRLPDGTVFEFVLDLTARRQAEETLASELKAMTWLHEPSRELVRSANLRSAQDLLLIERRHYQPNTAFPWKRRLCVRL